LKDPNVKPYHAKPYPVPQSQEKQIKDEIRGLCKYGVLRKINHTQDGHVLYVHNLKTGWFSAIIS
jgi:hypothetical protein